MTAGLHAYLGSSLGRFPDRVAVEDGAGLSTSYRDLYRLAAGLRDRLRRLGVRPGDRVGFYLPKSIDAVAAAHGIMMAGAAYVPVDPDAPPTRNALIHDDCGVRAVLVARRFEQAYAAALAERGATPPLLVLDEGDGEALPLQHCLRGLDRDDPAPPTQDYAAEPDELAYILYTSGSTGRPKGVMLTHRNAVSFVEWCRQVFTPDENDRASSHAPLHFDLSILDLYMTLGCGATLVLVPEAVGKDPVRLAPFIAERRISVWYSAPSILALLAQYGDLEQHDYSALRLVLFAGEVFPVKHLRALKALLPRPGYYNLYGPTETNVCTYFRVPDEIPAERTQPFPIGKACEHLQVIAVAEDGKAVAPGTEGELIARGPAVTSGYWNLPERNAEAFHLDENGERWYKTGDLVVEAPDGNFVFLGRRDRMIKKRGYRIELGEVEVCLYRHPKVAEVGVQSASDGESGVKVHAFYGTRDGQRLSAIALKAHCAELLPLYMVPDYFHHEEALPRTSTGKVDYQALRGRLR